MSILEVMFAILVGSIGLLGAIALFPVALAQARKGLQADAASAAGLSAIHTFDAYGMRQPARWRGFTGSANVHSAERRAFCIDPLFIADNFGKAVSTTNAHGHPARRDRFPSDGPAIGVEPASTLLRVSFASGAADPVLGRLAAQQIFRLDDDLVFERPTDRTLDAVQLYSPSPARRRQYQGRLSWFATLTPTADRMIFQFDGFQYVLSVIVVEDRSPNLDLESGTMSEWTGHIEPGDFHSNGQGGGDVTITAHEEDELEPLKVGEWVMLGHTSMQRRDGLQVPYFRWYRIVDAAPDVQPNGVEFTRDLTLSGHDWPADSDLDGTQELAIVAIVPGAIAVYEKTIRLEN